MAGCDIELRVVMQRTLLEILDLLLIFHIEFDSVAEAGAHRAIAFIGDPQDVDFGVLLAFYLGELDGVRGDIERDIDARGVGSGEEIGEVQGRGDGAGLSAGYAIFEIFFAGLPARRSTCFTLQ